VRRLFSDVTLVVLIVVAIGGLAAFFSVPGDTASRVALGLSIVAVVIATASYASSPDWDKISDDVAAIREAVEHVAASADDFPPHPAESGRGESRKTAALAAAGAILVTIYHRSRR
jgi:hypothetical protein